MDQFYMNMPEGYDVSFNDNDMKKYYKKNDKKKIILTIVISVLVITLIIILALSKKEKPISVEPFNMEITAKGNNLQEASVGITNLKISNAYMREDLLNLNEFRDKDGKITNLEIKVFKDGIYERHLTQAFNHKYVEEFNSGKINLDAINEYINDNKEVLLMLDKFTLDDNDQTDYNGIILTIGKEQYLIPLDSERYKDLYLLFNNSEKEIIQDVYLNKK